MSGPQEETAFWVLRGTMGDVSFAWSSQPATGYDHRLAAPPSGFSIGPAPVVSSSPERPQTTITLDNSDGALSRYVVGTNQLTAPLAYSEFSAPSILQIRARVCRAVVSGLTVTETAYSPTLILLGGIEVGEKEITFKLAADDDAMLGKVEGLLTVDEVVTKSGTVVWEDETGGAPGWATQEWQNLRAAARLGGIDAVVPWMYGNTAVQPIRVSDGDPSLYIIGFVDPVDPPTTPMVWFQEGIESGWGLLQWAFLVELDVGYLACMIRTHERIERDEGDLWVIRSEDELASASVGSIVSAVLDRHTKGGAASYDLASLTAASDMMGRYAGALCGVIAAETTMREVLEQICAPIGLRVWIGVDDKLHFASREISHADLRSVDEGLIPRIEPWEDYPATTDGIPSWAEAIPSGPEEVGAAASRVTIDWPEWSTTMLPEITRERRIAGLGWDLAAPDAELRIPGDWLNPTKGLLILNMLADRSAYPVRTVSMAMHPSIAEYPIGTLIRLTHPWGIGGFAERMVRLMRVEMRPAEHAALAMFEDLGPLDTLAVGKLDSIENWVIFNPETDPNRAALTIYFHGETAYLYGLNTPVPPGHFAFLEDHIGATIWGPPSIHPAHLGTTSYEILTANPGDEGYEIDPGAGVVISPPYSLPGAPVLTIPVPAPPPGSSLLDSPWLLMATHQWEDGVTRPGYITGSDLSTGEGRGYRFARG